MNKRFMHMSLLLIITVLVSMFFYNIPVFAAGFEVEIGSVKGNSGESVTVPVSFKNIPAAGVNCCDFVLNYDTSKLQIAVDGVTAGPITRNASEAFDFIIDESHGTLKFLYSDETGLGGDAILSNGVFANIKFLIKQNPAGGLCEVKAKGEWAFGNIVLECIDAGIKNGGVEVVGNIGYKVSGYIIPDLPIINQANISKSGFNVKITGTDINTGTDQNGFFELYIPNSASECTLNITKNGFLFREIKSIGLKNTSFHTEVSIKEAPIKMWVGDINNDRAINMTDIVELSAAFNAIKGDSRYKSEYDVNNDEAVNMSDIMAVVQHFNKVSSDYK